MIDSTRSPSPGCELAALGRAASPSPLLDERDVTATGSPREADAPSQRPLAAAEAARERPRRARSRSRTREIVESIIYLGTAADLDLAVDPADLERRLRR